MKKMYSNKPNSIKTIFLVSFLLLSIQQITAQIKVPFEQRTSAVSPDKKIYNIKGDYTMIGNTNLTLVSYGDNTSNDSPMRYVDVDTDASTWNSSSSTLNFASENGSVPECSNIIYAGLYWTGRATDGPTSPDVFDYTRSVNGNVPINQNYTVGHDDDIANTTYNMQITRGGTTNTTRYPIYSFSNGTDIYVFRYTNNTGANRVTLEINNGTPINIPVTVSGTTTLTATFVTPYQIVNGNVTLTINSLQRSSATNLSVGNTESTSFAGVNVSGTIPGLITETKTFDKRVVKIKGPNSASYTTVTANFDPLTASYDIYYPQNGDGFMYSAYAEITDYVKTNGLGSYTLADLALIEGSGGGTGFYGGWGIIVVYENSKMNWRDVTIFDGHSYVAGSITADFEIPVNGFNTVQAGPVNMKLGLMCGEGDRGIAGDYFQIRNHQDTAWTTLNHTGNSTNNFFNSSISTGGNVRNPNLLNNTGLDISMFNVPNPGNTIITNGQTSTRFRYGTTQDTFIIFTVAMSVDAYIPEVPGVISTTLVNNLPPVGAQPYTVLPGQEIEYEVVLYNTGSEATINNVITVPIPYGSTYVPNSIVTTLNYTPAPAVNSAVFNPLSGGNGSIIWNISEIPHPASPTTVLGTLKYRLRATTDCAILTNPNCNPSIITQGTTSGVGTISQIPYNLNFILGYTSSGACVNEPISGNLVTTIDAVDYINQNCQNTPLEYVFNYCSISGSIPVSLISGTFPTGTTFYNQFPVTTTATQYTSTTPFPGTIGTSTYYAVPPNSTGCYFVFNIVITNDFAVTQPQSIDLNGCTVASIPGLPYSTTPVTITPTQFINAGGTIVNQSLIISITYTDSIISTCPLVVRRNYVITTGCNNSPVINFTQTFTITDNSVPTISAAGANATIQCPATPTFTAPTATDNCGTATVNIVSTVTTPGNCAGNYSVTRTWNATDACGNASAPVSQTITVQDNSAPTISAAGANATIDCTATPTFTAPTATDNCGTATVNIVSTVTTPGNCAGNYTITRTWNATDACGNASASVSQTITVQDTSAPTISAAGANATIDCTATPTFTAPTATDNCGTATVNIVSTVTTPGNCAGNYTITRTWNATDACGNASAPVSQTITVQDNSAPTISAAGANATIDCTATPTFTAPTATDNCGTATVNIVSTVTTPGNCAGNYTITRTWNATDACGNASTPVSQTITVQDNSAPTISAAGANATIDCTATPTFTAPTATDNCGTATVNIVSTVTTPGNCAGNYTITRTWNATDACGNASAPVSQTITVQDNSAPTISAAGANATIDCTATPTFTAPTATDNCGTATVNIVSTVTTPGNCAGNYTITRTWNATDACGNASAPVSQTITVQDNSAPTISAAGANATIDCTATPTFTAPTATDNCGTATVNIVSTVTTPGNCAGNYTITRTWNATDACGNASTPVSQTITVQDNSAPTISAAGANATIDCTATPTFTAPTATDNCGTATVNIVSTVTTPGNCAGNYTITRTWNATDACGNASAPVSQTITVQDNSAPTISAAGANATIDCTATPTFTAPTATDNCGTATVNIVSTVTTPGNCAGNYTITRTWNATDACGNASAPVSQTITVQDNSAPTISAAGANATIDCTATPTFTAPTATDNCGTATVNIVSTVTTPGNCAGNYTITRTWNATDACGNASAPVSQTITVQDSTPPTITTQASNIIVDCDGQGNQNALTAWLNSNGGASATDLCSNVTWTNNFNSNTSNCSNAITVVFTATDDCDNFVTTSATFAIQDILAPVVPTAPADVTVSCADEVPAMVSLTALDNCSDEITVAGVDSIVQGDCPNSFTITRTWTFVDACQNTSSVSQTIIVNDELAPVVPTAPADVTVSCADEVPAMVSLTAVDNCSDEITVAGVDSIVPGDCPNSFTITRTWTFVDACQNTSSVSQTIIVNDELAPVVPTAPADVTVSCADEVPAMVSLTAVDNCSDEITVAGVDSIVPGDCPNSFTITRTWTFVDACQNTSSVSQTIIVNDELAPVVPTAPANVTVSCADEVPAMVSLTALDNCSDEITVDGVDSIVPGDCPNSFTITRTWTFVDACQNTSSVSQTIIVNDELAPVVPTAPADVTVSCADEVPAMVSLTAVDNCSDEITVAGVDSIVPGDCPNSFTITRTWTFVDACQNTSSVSQTIIVNDELAPVVPTAPANVTVSCADEVPAMVSLTALDNCSDEITVDGVDSIVPGDCPNSFTITRTWTFVDACQNTSSVSQTIIVNDELAPVVPTAPANVTVSCADEVPAMVSLTAVDNCSDEITVDGVDSIVPGDCPNSFTITRTWTFVDACQNTSSVSQTIIVNDELAPVVPTAPADVTVSCADEVPAMVSLTAVDNCSDEITVDGVDSIVPGDCPNSFTITRTWTFVDACQNTSSVSQTIIVNDELAPVVPTAPADVTVSCADEVPAMVSLTALDNCSDEITVDGVDSIVPGDCPNSFTITRTWTFVDACQNTSSVSQTIIVNDELAPVVPTAPANVTVSCADEVPAMVSLTALDNCSDEITVDGVDSIVPGDCPNSFTITRTWTFVDACQNTSSVSQTIIVNDELAPVVPTAPADVTVSCADEVPAMVSLTAVDNCSDEITVDGVDSIVPGDCPNSFTITRTWTFVDACQNTSSVSQTIIVNDELAPVVPTAPADVTASCADEVPAMVSLTALDNCSDEITVDGVDSIVPGDCPNSFTITRTWTFVDACQNTSSVSQTIIVNDELAPVVPTAPADVTVSCADEVPAMVSLTAVDNCSDEITVAGVDSIVPGDCPNSFTITRTWTFVDACQNTSSVSQTIIVNDELAPVVPTAPANVTVSCADEVPAMVSLTAVDNCSDEITVDGVDSIVPGDCPNSFTITRTWTFVDACQNTSSVSQTIIVNDELAPVVPTAPADVTVSCADEVPAMVSLTAVDNCSDEITVAGVDSIVPGDCPNSFTITRTWTFVDACQNTSSVSQTIIVNDELAPTLVGNLVTEINANCLKLPEVPVLEFVDNCSNTTTVVYNSTTTAVTENGTYAIIRTWTVSDVCGNAATFTQTVNVTISDFVQIGTLEEPEVCNGDIDLIVDLNEALETSFPNVPLTGTWSATPNSEGLVNGVFSPYEVPTGIYQFTYEYGSVQCPQRVIFTLTVNEDCIELPCEAILVHNAFSPNGDEYNEMFIIENITDSACYSEIKVQIFNRWGIKVYDAENYDNDKIVFKGISEGRSTLNANEMLPAGTYFYILDYKTSEGNYVTKNGYLYLSR